jgi:hypothetical protein
MVCRSPFVVLERRYSLPIDSEFGGEAALEGVLDLDAESGGGGHAIFV